MAKSSKPSQTELEQEINRKQERLRKREREQHRTLYIGVGVGLGLALLFLVFGIVYALFIQPNATVASLGSDKIVARDFQKRVLLEQSNLENALQFYAQREEQFGNQGIFTQQITEIQNTLASPFTMGQQTVDKMVQDILVQREAEARGITVTDAEVDEDLRAQVANQPGAGNRPAGDSHCRSMGQCDGHGRHVDAHARPAGTSAHRRRNCDGRHHDQCGADAHGHAGAAAHTGSHLRYGLHHRPGSAGRQCENHHRHEPG